MTKRITNQQVFDKLGEVAEALGSLADRVTALERPEATPKAAPRASKAKATFDAIMRDAITNAGFPHDSGKAEYIKRIARRGQGELLDYIASQGRYATTADGMPKAPLSPNGKAGRIAIAVAEALDAAHAW